MDNPLRIDGIDVFIEGEGEPVFMMLHGWPDTYRLWDAQVEGFKPHGRCVRFTLPGFDVTKPSRPMSLAQTMAFIEKVLAATSPARPVVLVLHDWGCLFGYEFARARPERVQAIVGVDIGDAGSTAHLRSLTLLSKAAIAAYQGWLALAWRLGGRLGQAMTRQMARWAHAPTEPRRIGVCMNYPYHLLWTGAYRSYLSHAWLEPPCPMLYLYGRRKPFMFHSPDWTAALAARPGCRVIPFQTGHWVMHEQPAEFNRVVLDWLSAGR